MVAITSGLVARGNSRASRLLPIASQVLIAAAVTALARYGYVLVALVLVAAVELRPLGWRRRWTAEQLLARMVPLLVGLSVALIVGLLPKVLAQLAVGLLYAGWRVWWQARPVAAPLGFASLLAVQAVVFEALFVMAAIWHPARPLMLVLTWLAAYLVVYPTLAARGERSAGVLAAAWALVATEVAWVFLTWLVSYIVPGYYLIVPQAALVLTAMAYCFGSIYLAQRSGSLNRARFTEYLLIGLILLVIVITGTNWRGQL